MIIQAKVEGPKRITAADIRVRFYQMGDGEVLSEYAAVQRMRAVLVEIADRSFCKDSAYAAKKALE